MLLPVLGTSLFDIASSDIRFGGLGSSCQNPFTKKFSCYKNESFRRLMYFSEPRAQAVPLFYSSTFYPYKMLHAEKVFSIMFDVSCLNAPSKICDLFTKANSKHKHETRFSSFRNYVQTSRLNQNQGSSSSSGAKLWNTIPNEFRQNLQPRLKALIIYRFFSKFVL